MNEMFLISCGVIKFSGISDVDFNDRVNQPVRNDPSLLRGDKRADHATGASESSRRQPGIPSWFYLLVLVLLQLFRTDITITQIIQSTSLPDEG